MTIEQLLAVGFTVCAGQIDRGHVNYGFMTSDGPMLNEAGQALASELLQPKQRKRLVRALPDEPGANDGKE